jgi:hypothetical protein
MMIAGLTAPTAGEVLDSVDEDIHKMARTSSVA